MSRWFRWYEQTCEDGKFRAVARLSRVTVRDVIALWAFILEDAANLDHRGVCERNEDFMLSVLDFADGEVDRVLSAMQDVGMVSIGHGGITVNNWNKRQFESDADPTAAERQRNKRARDKTVSHEPVTRDSRSPETENRIQRTERKKESIGRSQATRPKVSEQFSEFWKAYPRRQGANPKAPASKLFEAATKQGVDPALIIAGARRCASQDCDKIGTPYIPQAVKWLRDRRWEDYAAGPPGELTDEQREKMFAELRGGNGETQRRNSEKGNGLREAGVDAREVQGNGREGGAAVADNHERHSGMERLGTVFRGASGLRTVGDEADSLGDGSGNDRSGPLAGGV